MEKSTDPAKGLFLTSSTDHYLEQEYKKKR